MDSREVGEALSDGINCLTDICQASTAPADRDSWISTLILMQQGLETVKAGEVATTLVVSKALDDAISAMLSVMNSRGGDRLLSELTRLARVALVELGMPAAPT